jgi:hypothetical protein
MFSVTLPVAPTPQEERVERAEAAAISAARDASGKGDSNIDFTDS